MAWLDALARRELRAGPWTLELIETLLARLGDPHRALPSIHVAGTRGKGSTCALLDAALRASGLRVGLTTSPHLVSAGERIRISGRATPDPELLDLVRRVHAAAGDLDPSYFELMTAAAFLAFAEGGVDVAVVEVGLGGRLDATNVVRPFATGITRLGLDHADRLGATRAEIAREKAGIFKPGVQAIVAPGHPDAIAAVVEMAHAVGAPCRVLGARDVASAPATALPGAHQAENAAVACALLDAAAVASHGAVAADAAARREGFLSVRWRARLETLRGALGGDPIVDLLLDVAHDVDSVQALCDHFRGRVPSALVFSCLFGKDLQGMARLLASSAARHAPVFVPELDGPRARPASEVVATLRESGMSAVPAASVPAALESAARVARQAMGGASRRLVAAFGSFVLAGEVLRRIS